MKPLYTIDELLPCYDALMLMAGEIYEREILSEARPHEYETRTGVVLTVVDGGVI